MQRCVPFMASLTNVAIGALAQSHHNPDVTVVVVSYNTVHLLERLFSALEGSRGGLSIQVVVVDNASRDGSAKVLRARHARAELIENTVNVGFGRANNQAFPQARGRHVLLLNTDAFVEPDTLQKTVEFMNHHPDCGILGVKLVGEDGSLQPSCRYFPTPLNVFVAASGLQRFFPGLRMVDDMTWDHASVRECDWVPGCYYLVRREVMEKVGYLDPRFFLYYEEVDYCRRVQQAGWKIMYYPYTRVVHIGGGSAESEGSLTRRGRQLSVLQMESELLYFRKHYGVWGLVQAVCLNTLGNAMAAASAMVKHRDTKRAAGALEQTGRMFQVLAATRFGARPTR